MPTAKDQIELELDRLRSTWPAMTAVAPQAPHFSWEAWQEILLNLTHCKEDEMMVRGALRAIMHHSASKPTYLVHEDLLVVAIATHTKCWDFPWMGDLQEGEMR